jgi:hypothetical protein
VKKVKPKRPKAVPVEVEVDDEIFLFASAPKKWLPHTCPKCKKVKASTVGTAKRRFGFRTPTGKPTIIQSQCRTCRSESAKRAAAKKRAAASKKAKPKAAKKTTKAKTTKAKTTKAKTTKAKTTKAKTTKAKTTKAKTTHQDCRAEGSLENEASRTTRRTPDHRRRS